MELFRKSALQKLYSPDQLDQIIRITKPRNWFALLGICSLLVLAVIWSFFGTITTTISGPGIFMNTGGIQDIVAPGTGRIVWASQLKPGATIVPGQVIAEIISPSLQAGVQAAQDYLTDLETYKKNIIQTFNTTENTTAPLTKEQRQTLKEIELQIAAAQYQLNDLKLKKGLSTQVVSPINGHVLELMAGNNTFVTENVPILRTTGASKNLQVTVFLPALSGVGQIQPGMQVQIYPGAEMRSELGYVVGTVASVSEFPLSGTGLASLLQSEKLAALFSANSPPYRVDVNLIPDPNTVSGYKWSSPLGATHRLNAGLLCTAAIIIREQKPISLIVPSY